jgi:hypothetical protein
LVDKTIWLFSESVFLVLQVSFPDITFYETIDVRTSPPKFRRIVEEMPWSDAKPLGQPFLGYAEALRK